MAEIYTAPIKTATAKGVAVAFGNDWQKQNRPDGQMSLGKCDWGVFCNEVPGVNLLPQKENATHVLVGEKVSYEDFVKHTKSRKKVRSKAEIKEEIAEEDRHLNS